MANRFPLWGQAGWASAEVVGETHYAKAIRALFGTNFNPQGTDITIPVTLIPDAKNKHDRNAVGVWSDAGLIGHLPRAEAARYVQVLAALSKRGLQPEVTARIQGREWGEYDGRPPAFDASVRLDLAEPHMLVPANQAPGQDHRLLPSGSAVQVNDQQQSVPALQALVPPQGECWAYVTLHEMAGHLVEVRVGDTRVGDLSPKMSEVLLPILRHLAEQGLVTAARAIVKGNGGKTEVMLYIARVQDLPEDWRGAPARQAAPVSPPAPAPAPPPQAPPSSGRGTASVPASGPVTPGGAAPVGAIEPNWTTPVESMPATSGTLTSTSSINDAEWTAPGVGARAGIAAMMSNAAARPVSGGSAPVSPGGPPPAGTSAGTVSGSFPVTTPASPAAGTPSWTTTPDATPSWAVPGEPLPSWATAGEVTPSWSPPADPAPSWSTPESAATWTPQAEQTPSWATPPAERAAAWAPPADATPSWAEPGPPMPSWDDPGAAVPSWVSPSGGTPSWAEPSSALPGAGLPTLPSTGSLPGGSMPRLDPPGVAAAVSPPATTPVTPVSSSPGDPSSPELSGDQPADALAASPVSGAPGTPVSTVPFVSEPDPLTDPLADPLGGTFGAPVSPAPTDENITETTVIPALAAVVQLNAAAIAAAGPVSPAAADPVSGAPAEGNPHPAIPGAPTGIRFAVPPGWPVPPDGWYPPSGWRPDADWPLAPEGWQWWVPTWD
ncbi:hypothetical protein [Actinoplanes sp. NBRC 101535]|uniref:hypothetical protein n=1 Tax=Actinoplanes sp. NBRC 101535 TaxID=3032196 RepID=UPI0024A581F3|nr:hypothetical protein [Actinoplanes sp. NBRC 101535]GLX99923.1 hypothetical protein Acsp01_03030 [Actinoplanes sp. NBRC 101535]